MPITVLCDDILQTIIVLTVNSCHRGRDFHNDEDYPRDLDASLPEALITLVRLSQVDLRWRSLAVLSHALWARNVHVTRHMSAALLEELFVRTGRLPIHLRIFNASPKHPIWCRIPQLFQRCSGLCCQLEYDAQCMRVLMTTPAPLLQYCAIFYNAPSQTTNLWEQPFDLAPALRYLRLTRAGDPGDDLRGTWAPHHSTLSTSDVVSLGRIPHLTHLKLDFSANPSLRAPLPSPAFGSPVTLSHVEELSLRGSPSTIAYFLQALSLPVANIISAAYSFWPDPIVESMELVWDPLFSHFPSVDFPDFTASFSGNNHNFLMRHPNGRTLNVRFEVDGAQLGLDEESTRFLLPFIHIPPAYANQLQFLYGVAWMWLVSVPGFATSVRTVTISGSPQNAAFPFHAHFLFSAMVNVSTLLFEDQAAVENPSWYHLLQDATGLLGNQPLPNVLTIYLPVTSLEGTLSNTNLCDLVWDRHQNAMLSRLHFIELSAQGGPKSLVELKKISNELPVMISLSII